MRKIIISTFCGTLDNYGQVLQYLATQVYFEKIGWDASLLQVVSKRPVLTRIKNKIKTLLSFTGTLSPDVSKITSDTEQQVRNDFFLKAKKITERKEKEQPRHFEEFRKRWFNYTFCNNVMNNPPEADVYCVGSDQYWSWCDDLNFLNYGLPAVKRISFSASFGAYKPTTESEWDLLRNMLSRFDLVTIRESSGKAICNRAGRQDAVVVPDPTLLLSPEEYRQFESPIIKTSKNYIFVYLLGTPTRVDVDMIYRFGEQEKLEIVYVTSQGREDGFPQTAATVPEWLTYIRNAKYVMTNSFHGTAFSILYKKQFLVFPLQPPFDTMNDRIYTLLTDHHLTDRLFQGDYNTIKQNISFVHSDQFLNKAKEQLQELIQKTFYE